MSSKKFKSGLESLFDNAEREFQDDNFALAEKPEAKAVSSGATARSKKSKGRSGKSFTSDLDSLFDLTVEKRQEMRKPEAAARTAPKTKSAQTKVHERKPLSGLDALIRQTVELDSSGRSGKQSKRVTFSYDRKKLDKIKRIARMKRLYLKDIMAEIVNGYLDEYITKNGDPGSVGE